MMIKAMIKFDWSVKLDLEFLRDFQRFPDELVDKKLSYLDVPEGTMVFPISRPIGRFIDPHTFAPCEHPIMIEGLTRTTRTYRISQAFNISSIIEHPWDSMMVEYLFCPFSHPVTRFEVDTKYLGFVVHREYLKL